MALCERLGLVTDAEAWYACDRCLAAKVHRKEPPQGWDDEYPWPFLEPPACPAARVVGEDDGTEHAQPGSDAASLCGIPPQRLLMYRHLFYGERGTDCPTCAERVWTLPRRR